MSRSKTGPKAPFAARLTEDECFTILRGLKHAEELVMRAAAPTELAAAAAEAADYAMLRERLTTDFVAQGLGFHGASHT